MGYQKNMQTITIIQPCHVTVSFFNACCGKGGYEEDLLNELIFCSKSYKSVSALHMLAASFLWRQRRLRGRCSQRIYFVQLVLSKNFNFMHTSRDGSSIFSSIPFPVFSRTGYREKIYVCPIYSFPSSCKRR